jgi:hypothetical protein
VRFQGISASVDSREFSFDRAFGWQGPSSELNLNVGTEEKRRQAAALPKYGHRAGAVVRIALRICELEFAILATKKAAEKPPRKKLALLPTK